MTIDIKHLPSGFKPYDFKSLRLESISLKQAIDLGSEPPLSVLADLITELSGNKIDGSKLVPVDIKYIIASLSFQAYPDQSWTMNVPCPHCNKVQQKTLTIKDFPAISCFDDTDEYPLKIDDGTHVYELGYPSIDAYDKLNDNSSPLDLVVAHILAIDGSSENIEDTLLGLKDFGVLSVMVQTIKKFFQIDTYSEFTCSACNESYRVAMSALEVTHYTPFHNETSSSRYQTNFRL
jgi:hypothetical protein